MDTSNSNGAPGAQTPIEHEVALMRQMTTRELRKKYAEVFGYATRCRHKQHLIKQIAWRIQANREGGLSERDLKRAAELANDADLRLTAPVTMQNDQIPPGGFLSRIYQDQGTQADRVWRGSRDAGQCAAGGQTHGAGHSL